MSYSIICSPILRGKKIFVPGNGGRGEGWRPPVLPFSTALSQVKKSYKIQMKMPSCQHFESCDLQSWPKYFRQTVAFL